MSSGCLDDAAVARLIAGEVSAEERSAALAHADGCEACHELLAAVFHQADTAEAVDVEDETLPAGPTTPSKRGPRAGDQIDHYVIVGVIGEGAMGVVVQARDTQLGRDVALKLLSRTTTATSERRLTREAQAMAQLTHPNVVTVHGVGRYKDGVYIAMELVRGETLGAWTSAAPREWAEILELFIKAGEGLAAAHVVGLVHRDFKPDNVLVREDGHVLVTDFGLAGVGDDWTPSHDSNGLELGVSLTRTGVVMGTPRYMAPEQLESGPVDARADQFAFAVSLYSAMYGSFPFSGKNLESLRQSVSGGVPAEPTTRSDAPAALWPVLERALSRHPADRYADMPALIAELRQLVHRPSRRRRWALVGLVGSGALVGGLAIGFWIEPKPCKSLEDRLDGIWDSARIQRLSEALAAGPDREATSQTLDRIGPRLDAYAQRWVDRATEICEATHEHGVQTKELLDARMRCLDERRVALRTFVDLLAVNVDAAALTGAVEAAADLPSIDDCARLQHGPAHVVEELDRLTELETLQRLGRHDDVVLGGEALLDRLRTPRAKARVQLAMGRAHLGQLRFKDAERTLSDAALSAAEAGDDALVAEARVDLLGAVVIGQERYLEADVVADAARLAMRRAGESPRLNIKLAILVGRIQRARSKHADGLAELDAALELSEESGADDVLRATLLLQRSLSLAALDRTPEAVDDGMLGLEIRRAEFGEQHPAVAEALQVVGHAHASSGQPEQGREYYEEALASLLRYGAVGSVTQSEILFELAKADLALHRIEDATQHAQQALSILDELGEGRSPFAASVRALLGTGYSLKGRHDDALRELSIVIEARESMLGHDDPALASDLHAYALALRRASQYDRAQPVFERLAVVAKRGSVHVAYAWAGLGVCRVERGHEGARSALKQALELDKATPMDAHERAEVLLALARIVRAEGEEAQALELAHKAFPLTSGPGSKRLRDQLTNFVAP